MLSIRPAILSDAADIVRIHITIWKANFESFMTVEQVKLKDLDEVNQLKVWQRRFIEEEGKSRHTFIAEIDETSAGYITGRDTSGDYDAELHQIYVLPDANRRGIGKKLVAQLAQAVHENGKQSMLVWVMTINPAVAFYRDALCGKYVGERIIPDGDGILKEAAYAWTDLEVLFT